MFTSKAILCQIINWEWIKLSKVSADTDTSMSTIANPMTEPQWWSHDFMDYDLVSEYPGQTKSQDFETDFDSGLINDGLY